MSSNTGVDAAVGAPELHECWACGQKEIADRMKKTGQFANNQPAMICQPCPLEFGIREYFRHKSISAVIAREQQKEEAKEP